MDELAFTFTREPIHQWLEWSRAIHKELLLRSRDSAVEHITLHHNHCRNFAFCHFTPHLSLYSLSLLLPYLSPSLP